MREIPRRVIGAVNLGRPDAEFVPAVIARVDQIVRREGIRVLTNRLPRVARRVVAAPGVREPGQQRPGPAKTFHGRDLPGPVVRPGARHVAHHMARRRQAWRQRVRRDVAPVVGRAELRVRAGIANDRLYAIGAPGLADVLPEERLAQATPHESRFQRHAAAQLPLNVERRFPREWELQPGIDRLAARCRERRPLFTRLPESCRRCRPPIGTGSRLGGVGVRVESKVGRRDRRIDAVARLRQCLRIFRQRIDDAEPR